MPRQAGLIFVIAYVLMFNVKAQNQTIPGEIITPYPTLINIGVEWIIQGDDNENGVVKVKFREKGSKEWREGMPFRRVPAGEKSTGNAQFKWENKHAGSIFDLTPDTSYEINLSLVDPDGGASEKTVEVRTRPEPKITPGAEIIEVPSGTYDTLFTKSGTKERPVVYRCKDGGIAIYKFIDLRNRKWVFIEKLFVDNLFDRGVGISLNGAENCVVTGCTVTAVYGIVADNAPAVNCYISDNVVTGVSQWSNQAMGVSGENIGEGIEMSGPGNVICYNLVTGFRDGISTMEERRAVNQKCIDIYNNDIYNCPDDGIESDFCLSNCRVFRNRLTNVYVGLSFQPSLGGPNYFIRNVIYNGVHDPFKLKRGSLGDVVLHNTVVKIGTALGGNLSMDYAYFRNNLVIGGPNGDINWGNFGAGRPFATDIPQPGNHSSFDYDVVGVYGTKYIARIGDKPFSEVEPHGVENITLDETFNNVEFPNPPVPSRKVADLRLRKGAAAIDAALRIPNINDDYKGKAPDAGAYEFGQTLPQYGPRN
jgi:hypothetical protein